MLCGILLARGVPALCMPMRLMVLVTAPLQLLVLVLRCFGGRCGTNARASPGRPFVAGAEEQSSVRETPVDLQRVMKVRVCVRCALAPCSPDNFVAFVGCVI